MSDIMLFGVLEMPPELWHSDPIDIAQRHGRYKQAAQRIRDDEEKIAARDAEIAELRALAAERSECAEQAGDVAAEAIAAQRKAEAERDEAGECVRRLYRALHAAVTDAGRAAHLEWIETLASTPEHLR